VWLLAWESTKVCGEVEASKKFEHMAPVEKPVFAWLYGHKVD
jgi:hypothetical protein